MPATLERLKTALADRYAIERAVGHGGMATVYLAEDLKHRRKVAVKVLSPEIATAVGADRFLREIEIAAGLQHPHVVPLYDSGEADGLLYYVMPYIEGEALSARIEREGALPIDEALRILRDVVDALSYAHARGVVHRDIKPDNVMFSGSHAVVLDFGVAKALREAVGSSELTTTGLALGTPAYMAPEQATAEPTVDHRADIYAVGILAYEMIAGLPPFRGTTPQAILGAHLTKAPEPIETLREDVPSTVSALINQCLEKEPERRVQDTSDLLAQIGTLATPSGTASFAAASSGPSGLLKSAQLIAFYSVKAAAVAGISYALMMALGLPDFVFPFTVVLLILGLPILLSTLRLERRRESAELGRLPTASESKVSRWLTWPRAFSGGLAAFTLLSLLVAGYVAMRTLGIGPLGTLVATGVLDENDRVILTEFVDQSGDTTLASAVTEAFRVDLGQSPTITLVQGNELNQAFARMEREPPTILTVELAREVAAREGVKAVVSGEINSVGGSYVLSAELLGVSSGDILVSLRETARDSTELIAALDRLSKGLRERVGESLISLRSGPALRRVTTASLPALRRFSQASRAMDAGDAGRAVSLFQEAIELDTAFAAAHRGLAIQLSNYGIDRALATTSMNKAYEYRDRLTEKERLWTEGSYHMGRGDMEEALSAYQTLLDLKPDDGAVINNIGVVYNLNRQNERALEYYVRARDLEPTSSNASFNVVVNNIELGRLVEARAENERFADAVPGHPMHQINRYFIAIAEFDYATAAEAMDAWAEFGDQASVALITSNHLGLAAIAGQTSAAELALEESRTRAASGRQVREYLRDVIGAGLYEIGALGSADQAVAKVELALESFPLDALEPFDRPYLELAEFYARAGRLDRARLMLAQFASEVPEDLRVLTNAELHRAQAFLALAEDRTDDALDGFLQSDRGSCPVCVLPGLAQLYDRQGNSDSLFAVLDRYVNSYDDDRFMIDALELPGAYVRLGELYEARGDRENAIDYYDRFVDLWQNADAQLKPQVDDVRRRISRLASESGTSR
jgi:tetratricopeptide (TPR) repeat protein/tRNA A-37 threonylcarbamoyl transferase component Bud32